MTNTIRKRFNLSWEPNFNTRICSAHFVNGEKSEDPRKVNYYPTIFPDAYRKPVKTDQRRTERLIARTNEKLKHQTFLAPTLESNVESNDFDHVEVGGSNTPSHVEIAIQTDHYEDNTHDDSCNILFCSIMNNDASTQTYIQVKKPTRRQNVIIDQEELERYEHSIKTVKTVACGSDENKDIWFTGYSSVKNEEAMRCLAGVSMHFFAILLGMIAPGEVGQPNYYRTLSRENRLLLFMMKMKLGLSFSALSWIFQVSRQTSSSIFFEILKTLVIKTKPWMFWPSRHAIKSTMPDSFENYPNCRCIIDCTEIFIDTPPKVSHRVLMYSSYKGGFTIKYLVVISPSGQIIFISRGYGGRATDGFVVNDSGFLDYLEPGDEVLADKGFPQIKTEMLQRQCTIVMPPFATESQFSREEAAEGYSIASVRIHIERAIQRIKVYKVLQKLNVELFDYADDIMFLCCIFANNNKPLIKK